MAEHPNVALVRRAMQAMNEMDMSKADEAMAVVDAFMADDIVWHEIGRAEPRRGKDELRATMSEFNDTTIKYDLHDVIANDEHAIALGTATATRNGRPSNTGLRRSSTSAMGGPSSAGPSRTTPRRSSRSSRRT